MRSALGNCFVLGASAMCLLSVACHTESDQRFPVQSNAQGVTSEAPPAKAAERRDAALVRFVNAVPDIGAVDLYADSMLVITNIAYKTITPFQELPDDRFTFRLRPNGQHMAEALATETEGLGAGAHYSIVAFSESDVGKADLHVYSDDLTPPDAGKAKLRIINASPDVGEVDVSAPGGDDALFSGVNFKSSTKYANINPMRAELLIHREGEKTPLLKVPSMALQAGRIYTLILVGRASGNPKLETLSIEDRLGDQP